MRRTIYTHRCPGSLTYTLVISKSFNSTGLQGSFHAVMLHLLHIESLIRKNIVPRHPGLSPRYFDLLPGHRERHHCRCYSKDQAASDSEKTLKAHISAHDSLRLLLPERRSVNICRQNLCSGHVGLDISRSSFIGHLYGSFSLDRPSFPSHSSGSIWLIWLIQLDSLGTRLIYEV